MKSIGLLIVAVALLTSCHTRKSEYLKISGFAQGTTYNITYENSKNEDYSQAIDSILKAFDQSLSIYDSSSVISRINNDDPSVEADDWFIDVFNKSAEINAVSEGAFDITVGPVVRAWGFSTGPVAKHDTAYIDSLEQYVGMDKVKLEGRKIIKKYSGVKLDVNAIAQGYSVDVVCNFFQKKGIKNYLVEIGGEVRGKGTNAKDIYWHIGIDRPVDDNMLPGNELQAIIEINNKALATSGNYRKFFVENGIKYAHTINPKTGFPARNTLLCTTVVCDDCITADGYATSFMVLGLEKSKVLLSKLQGVEVYFVYSNPQGEYEVFFSEGMKNMIIEQE
ncbi:MAG TPA: FAD:protein FMN transferase [Prolixibacteraceae bacterium]|nr:FAD:protein FMN transferase [Prolixibacteraceae bacterium]